MKTSKFTEAQIMFALKQAELGSTAWGGRAYAVSNLADSIG